MLVDWDTRLIKHLDLYTDIHGNEIWPIVTKAQFLEFSRLCYEHKQLVKSVDLNFKPTPITDEGIKELSDFWDFFVKKANNDGTVMTLTYDKKKEVYTTIVYYKDKIKDVKEIKGDKVGD